MSVEWRYPEPLSQARCRPMQTRPKILALSSEVTRGRVGLSIATPCLSRLGCDVFAVPTVLFANRPGLGRPVRHSIPVPTFTEFLSALEQDGCFDELSAILTGYFGHHEQISATAELIRGLKKRNPELVVLCDPILGDRPAGLYVSREIAHGIARDLVPQADILTPNLFEIEWLSGLKAEEPDFLDRLNDWRHRQGLRCILVTSYAVTDSDIQSALITDIGVEKLKNHRFDNVPHGTGDALSALFLASYVRTRSFPDAAKTGIRQIESLAKAASGAESISPEDLNI